jgi:hypothetical protein
MECRVIETIMISGVNITKLSLKKEKKPFSFNSVFLNVSSINFIMEYLKKEYIKIINKSSKIM